MPTRQSSDGFGDESPNPFGYAMGSSRPSFETTQAIALYNRQLSANTKYVGVSTTLNWVLAVIPWSVRVHAHVVPPTASPGSARSDAPTTLALRSSRDDAHFFSTSFMPHLGQSPGLFCTTSGCIGQVYWIVFSLFAEGWSLLWVGGSLWLEPVHPVAMRPAMPTTMTSATAFIHLARFMYYFLFDLFD